MKSKKTILLVEPEFPIPPKSKNHANFLPIGLLKLASYYREKGYKVKLVRGKIDKSEANFNPYKILITSLFTYWSEYVRDCVQHYKSIFPKTHITVGGIYASLMPKHCKDYTGCNKVFIGTHKYAEKKPPAYDLIYNPHPLDYQIIHSSRGCFRKCKFCGTWKIEPKLIFKESIKNEICSNKLVFYDNNLLTNPHIKNILEEIATFRYKNKPIICESQSGFDGRLLDNHMATLLKKARFINPRIAWDGTYKNHKNIKKQIDILIKAGYEPRDIYVFVLYNWEIAFNEMEKKRIKCWHWGVQISDCRFRPLDQTYDHYSPRKEQSKNAYYIHSKWTDREVKQFRKNVRRQNICIRQNLEFYSRELENKKIDKKIANKIKNYPKHKVKTLVNDSWYPEYICNIG